MHQLRAVMFDVGGVVVTSPLLSIFEYERQHGLPENYLNVQITRRGSHGAWQRFERGELNIHDFYKAFGQELSDTVSGNKWYREFCDQRQYKCPTLPTDLHVNGRELFGAMMRGNKYDPIVVEAIRRIRAKGQWKVIALTNNFSVPYDAIRNAPAIGDFSPHVELEFLGWAENGGPANFQLRAMFDDFIDSSAVGKRKPEPEFYLYACEKHGLNPNEIVFLDDLGMNLKPAKELGMQTIHVQIGKSKDAIRSLERLLGLELLAESQVVSKM